MNYATEFKKFATSQYIFSAVRITLAIVVPSIILAHFGLLKEYFLFPLATSFVGLTDQPGPFVRRRNSLLLATVCFLFVSVVASLLQNFPILIYFEIIVLGMFFSMLGVYGQRFAAVGSLSLVVMAIFINGHLTGNNIVQSSVIFFAGSVWYILIFMVVSRIQPYKLAAQMIGENYVELADYLSIKSKFYLPDPDFEKLNMQLIAQQVKIKNLQEDTRETVFKTRKIVKEATTTSRLLMLMFLNSIDLHEKLMTSDSDYRKIQKNFGDSGLLITLSEYLTTLANELTNIGIALQGGTKAKPLRDIDEQLDIVFGQYFDLRNRKLNDQNLEHFMVLRLILVRITDVTEELKMMYKVFSSDQKLAKSLSTGLDLSEFIPSRNKLNFQVFRNNFSLKSSQFRHSIRIVLALLIGYFISTFDFLGLGHSYWILITTVAIMRPAYATTKHRNRLRFFGTVAGAVLAYGMLMTIHSGTLLFALLMLNMILCFSFLKANYFWAVLFMTVYIFLSFNFLRPGNVNMIFKDRILDTLIAGIVVFAISYFVLPVWEHTQNLEFMQKSSKSNLRYFETVMEFFKNKDASLQEYKLSRKDAIIDLANLSDNFNRMISDPKNQQKKMEHIHQFVNTAHLITAYTASFAQYPKSAKDYPEIDFDGWARKISAELGRTDKILHQEKFDKEIAKESALQPEDSVERLMEIRRREIRENEISDRRDQNRITHLTELKNLQEILELIYDAAKEQRKGTEKLEPEIQSTIVKT
ncbi:FUSC family protein [Kaistella palustris]|uniref:FUSC family protein n=1 Tax=Kaistella palustris TaxID=493376 RepID=UPI00041D4898|nr:FUSC family membrane protein [Kaistella palustris]